MSEVHIEPLAPWMRKTRFRAMHPPVFPAGPPTRDDAELALALIAELDDESRAWYGDALIERLRARL